MLLAKEDGGSGGGWGRGLVAERFGRTKNGISEMSVGGEEGRSPKDCEEGGRAESEEQRGR